MGKEFFKGILGKEDIFV